jgi:hypothetical protein
VGEIIYCPKCESAILGKMDKYGFFECRFCHKKIAPNKKTSKHHTANDVFDIMKKLYKQNDK